MRKRRILKLSLLTVVLAIAGMIVLMSASVYTFQTLTDEATVAELRFERLGDQQFLARVRTGDGCTERTFEIYGDQWRVDAQFLKWKYWALLLGLDAQYRLERIEGRYSRIEEQNTSRQLAHSLEPQNAIDVLRFSEALGPFNFLVDATYGSSTYMDIDTERVFYVYRTQTALITRSQERNPNAEPGLGLSAAARRNCADEPGVWQRITRWTDDQVTKLL